MKHQNGTSEIKEVEKRPPRRRSRPHEWTGIVGILIGILVANIPFAMVLQLVLSFVLGVPYFISDAAAGRAWMLWLNSSWMGFFLSYALSLLLIFVYAWRQS